MTHDTAETAEIEDLVAAVGERHGFRMREYALVWDGGQFIPDRAMHTLDIITSDGRRAMAEISDAALSDDDPWIYLRRVNAAFELLRRRASE